MVVPVASSCQGDGSVMRRFGGGGAVGVGGDVGAGRRRQEAGLHWHHGFEWNSNLTRNKCFKLEVLKSFTGSDSLMQTKGV